MDNQKAYYIEGLEKYQHFSTGLMFAITAAAIQSAKVGQASGLQSGLEIFSWVLLLASSVIGLFNARATSILIMTHDTIFLIRDRMNRMTTEDPEIIYQEVNAKGETINRNRAEQFTYLKTDYEKTINNYNLEKGIIDRRTSVQVWAFTFGLVVLGCGRAIPLFQHTSPEPAAITLAK